MSVTNPNKPITKQDLADFYGEILPYLGGSADAGFTPVGTVISVMGVTAPANYLACNGQVVNIADYPELANYFYQQFGSKNKFGGNGTTTFGIPDLRGEFLRGTGTNSHTNQGNGSTVGTHQDATQHLRLFASDAKTLAYYGESANNNLKNADASVGSVTTGHKITSTDYTSSNAIIAYTSKPTNTSVLYCIATKNIYLNPSNDYSTDEKVVGTWISGETLYQKTIVGTISVDTDKTSKNTTLGNVSTDIDTVVSIDGIRVHENKSVFVSLSVASERTDNTVYVCNLFINNSTGNLVVEDNRLADNGRNIIATVRYTKTT